MSLSGLKVSFALHHPIENLVFPNPVLPKTSVQEYFVTQKYCALLPIGLFKRNPLYPDLLGYITFSYDQQLPQMNSEVMSECT